MRERTRGLGERCGYEIRLQGHISERWSAFFEGMTLSQDSDGTTRMWSPALDQAALHGLLAKVRDLGLPLISVTSIPIPQDIEEEPTHS